MMVLMKSDQNKWVILGTTLENREFVHNVSAPRVPYYLPVFGLVQPYLGQQLDEPD
jgi:hypothetical protein